MENKNPRNDAKKNRLEWGEHNPKLTDANFIDRNPRKKLNLVVSSSETLILEEEIAVEDKNKG